MIRRLAAAATVCVAVIATAVAVQQPAQAISGSEFLPGNIISDSVFYDSSTLTANGVQSFLNAQYQGCASGYVCLRDYRTTTTSQPAEPGLCSAYTGQASETSAAVIANVSRACGVNPQVLLVLLQKESGLVTTTTPDYRAATGFGCPDSTGCDAKYFGFFNQVYLAARQFKRYRLYPTDYNYVAGRSNYILYNPKTSCGGTQVYIQNQATAGLYDYTPYQPNAAALANLHGTGDSCSAYGNRNFWVFFNSWFSVPSAPYDRGGLVLTKPDGTLWYYRNTGSATQPFASGVQIGLSGWQRVDHVVAGDVDGDGLADLVVTRAGGTLWLYRNNGTSLPYSSRVEIGASGWGAFDRIEAGDVNGDGRTDLILTKPDGTLWLYLNTGSATRPFSTHSRIGASGWQVYDKIIPADVDGDGRVDLVARKPDGSLWLYGNTGDPARPYVHRGQIGTGGWGAFVQLTAADVDADGRADLVGTKQDGSLWLYHNNASVSRPFANPLRIGNSGWQAFDRLVSSAVPVPRRPVAADLVARKPDGSLWQYPADTSPRPFASSTRIGASGWQGFDQLAVADVDGDGRADLVARRPAGSLWLYRNTGTASHPYGRAVRIGASGWQVYDQIMVADVDGDGRADLVARTPAGALWQYRNTGVADHPFAARTRIGASGWQAYNRIALTDVDGDGRADLVATEPSGALWQYRNTGDAGHPFGSRTQSALTGWQDYDAITAADVDLDGTGDLIARKPNGDPPGSGAAAAGGGTLWLGRTGGQGRFPAPTQIGSGGWDAFDLIAAGDVDGDGHADLIARTPAGELWLYRNTAAAARPYLAHTRIGASGWQNYDTILRADTGGDGLADLVTRTPAGALWLYRNTGDAARPYSKRVQVGLSGWDQYVQLVAGDVDGDGRADLVATGADGTLWLYHNTGNLSRLFAPRVSIGSGWQSYDLFAAADVTGDGLADLVARRSDGGLWLWANRHDPGRPYATPSSLGTGWQQYDQLVAGDVDQSGGADVVARQPSGGPPGSGGVAAGGGTLWFSRNNGSDAPIGPPAEIGASGWQTFDLLAL